MVRTVRHARTCLRGWGGGNHAKQEEEMKGERGEGGPFGGGERREQGLPTLAFFYHAYHRQVKGCCAIQPPHPSVDALVPDTAPQLLRSVACGVTLLLLLLLLFAGVNLELPANTHIWALRRPASQEKEAATGAIQSVVGVLAREAGQGLS